MTEIIERRLKCDYCGNVSPVQVDVGTMPRGWLLSGDGMKWLHFCTRNHYDIWWERMMLKAILSGNEDAQT